MKELFYSESDTTDIYVVQETSKTGWSETYRVRKNFQAYDFEFITRDQKKAIVYFGESVPYWEVVLEP